MPRLPDEKRTGAAIVDAIAEARAAYDAHGAVMVRGALGHAQAVELAALVMSARDAWTPAFDGEQWSLGRAFYTHLEEGIDGDYFGDTRGSDALVERHAPGLQALVRALASAVLGAPVHPRDGFCGPGVHVFLPGDPVAEHGGAIHFDTEGLTPAQVRTRVPAATLVLMLRPPPARGGTTVWDAHYAGHDHPTPADLASAKAVLRYAAGDLLLLDAYRLHQIEPFEGGERVSATAHLAMRPNGSWESWF